MNTRCDRPDREIHSIVGLFSSGQDFLNYLVKLSVRKCMLGKEKDLRKV